MKKMLFCLLLAAVYCTPTSADDNHPKGAFKLISYNVRNSGMDDGQNQWPKRSHATKNMLEQEKPDVFGIQEGLKDQIEFLDSQCTQYARVGVGRDDGVMGGEIMAIYYLRDRFELLDSGTLWLSETPTEVSRGWDGACNRTMTWVKLKDKTSGKAFFFFNTHLDHKGRQARQESIKLITSEIERIAGKKHPAILGGDFNSPVDNPIYDPLKKFMSDVREKAPVTDSKGTFNGFGSAPDTILIDHLFYRGGLKCQSFRTLDGNYGVGYISDHYPIEMIFTLK